jgi:hypothetical protein
VQVTQASQLPAVQPAHQRTNEPKPVKITGKVRDAINAMVWDALPRKQAAEKAGISEHGLYKALRKPPVRAFYLSELEVLRTSERARNIHTLAEVRDQTTNQMARVQAVKALEQLEDVQQSAGARHQSPGFVINIISPSGGGTLSAHQAQIEPKTLKTLDADSYQADNEAPPGGGGGGKIGARSDRW